MAEIVIEKVTKRFEKFTAVDAVDIKFRSGEVSCLLGSSGCGKTTLMRMIAGLETPTAGRILIDGRDVTALATKHRNIGMVFQYPVMYQTLTVRENILEPLRRQKLDKAERERRVDQMLELLDMRDLANSYIDGLDAGQSQKVAVGREVARQTAVILLDEPTTNVELNAKIQLIRAFKEITRELKQTIIYVTHDQTEAMTLADHIALMQDGNIVQYDEPHELYSHPTTTFGGWFLGNPGMNFLPAERKGEGLAAPLLAQPLPVPADLPAEGELRIGVRPEQIKLVPAAEAGTVSGKLLERSINIAGRYLLKVKLGASGVTVKMPGRYDGAPGDEVHLAVKPADVAVFADGKRVG